MKKLTSLFLVLVISFCAIPQSAYAAAPVIASQGTFGPANRDIGENVAVSKPTGLAENDLMVAHITCASSAGGIGAVNIASGWTQMTNTVQDSGANSVRQRLDYKIATAGDTGASTFNWGVGFSGGAMCHGIIYRITGYSGTPTANAAGNSSASWAATVTPTQANSLIIMAVSAAANAASGSLSSYAVATDDPTWAETFDSFAVGVADGDMLAGGASADRTAVSATGNASATFTTFGAGTSVGGLVVVDPVAVAIIKRPPVLWYIF